MTQLAAKSLTVSRPIVFHYLQEPTRMHDMARSLFAALADGTLRAESGQSFPLAEAAQAHAALESRTTLESAAPRFQ